MKKLVLIFCLLSSLCFAQERQKSTPKLKNIKLGIACGGAFIIAGSIVNVVRTYQKEPTPYNGLTQEMYNQKQKDYSRVSSMLYGFAGLSLISICFNF